MGKLQGRGGGTVNIFPKMTQGSEEWFRARKGRVTASQASRILTPKGKDSAQWSDYVVELVAECIRPDEIPAFTGNMHTDRGNTLEAEARQWFADHTGYDIREVGFVTRDDNVVGCSPDALIYQDETPVGGLEIKSPMAKNHLAYLVDGVIPSIYLPQVHFSMAVTGLPWTFVSYCPGMAPLIVHADPDEYTERMADAIDRFVIFYGSKREALLQLAKGGAE